MTSADSSPFARLRALRSDLDAATPADGSAIAAARTVLTHVGTSVRDAHPDAQRLLTLVGDLLAAIEANAGTGLDDARRHAVARGAIGAVAEHLADPGDFGKELLIIQAAQQMLRALERDPKEWNAGAGSAPAAPSGVLRPASPPLSLDDTAALLLMAEPHERAEMEQLRVSLGAIAADETVVELVRSLAQEAVASISRVLDQMEAGADLAGELAQLTGYVDEAVRARDEAENVAMSAQPESVAAVVAAADGAYGAGPDAALQTDDSTRTPDVLQETLLDGDRELIADFVTECRDYLDSAERALLQLETNPTDSEAINTVFRAFHTVKGTSGFLGLTTITSFAHEAESLFTRVRDREIPFAGGVPDLALQAVDVVKALIATVEQALAGKPMTRPAAYDAVLAQLARVACGASGVVALLVPSQQTPSACAAARTPAAEGQADILATAPARAAWTGEERREVTSESSIRVRTDRLDRLIDMIAELIIAQTMIAQDTELPGASHNGLARKVSHAGKIVRELHDLSLSMRMVPLKPTFQKMTRLVRDVAQAVGKQIEFSTDGEETEIDRNMVDALSDPLVHMVRNAVDHGIEIPDERIAAGKPRQGRIRLSASHAGGNVVVELRDDGKGLDRERIIAKAIEKGLIESASKMSDSEIFTLIFAPGFSTAAQVTGLSGRGVGMDVVRRNIESLRGLIEIASSPGQGTVFTLRLPLTLAVTDGMLVQVGAERYVIPTTSIFMSFRPERDALSTVAGRGEMVRLRNEVMPLFRLHRLFSIPAAQSDPCQALVVVVAVGNQRVALLVDALLGQQQVVAKSLGDGVGKVEGVSGGAILGDGRVGLILDIAELITLLRRRDDIAEPMRAVA
jgi:two-component system chemotaxis sensor kinase CheA